MITVILVALIIIVPLVAFSWVAYGPASLDSVTIQAVAPDMSKRDGVTVVATTVGSGQDFSGSMDLLIYHDNEQVYSGKADFVEGLLNQKVRFEEFSVGNGDYEFRLISGELSDRYVMELDVIVEELGVVSSPTYNYPDAPQFNSWEAVYVFHTVFRTGWHFFTHIINPSDGFKSYELGYRSIDDPPAPMKVETGPEHGITVEVWFTGASGGLGNRIHSWDVAAGDSLDTTLTFTQNGTYIVNYVNKKTVDIAIKAYENRPVDKLPSGRSLDITQALGTQTDKETQLISRIDQHSGYIRPKFKAGDYDMTIEYENTQVKTGSDLATVKFTEKILLNDLPKANPKANPNTISSINPLQRTVTFNAEDSFDDGPMADLTVFWSFGSNSVGEIGSMEGPWEEFKEVTFYYPPGEDPDVINGKPFLILKDAHGAESAVAYVNLNVS